MPRPAGAFGLKSAKFDVVDQNGTPVSAHDVHLHHIVMTTSARQDQLCPGRRERFIGSGMERTPINLWGPYAYLVGANDQWGSIYHLMNETPPGTPAKTVYIQYTLGYQPGANATNSRPVDAYFHGRHRLRQLDLRRARQRRPRQRPHEVRAPGPRPVTGSRCSPAATSTRAASTSRCKDSTPGSPACTGTATYHENPRHLATINPCILHDKVDRRPQLHRHRPLRQLAAMGGRDGHRADLRLVGHPVAVGV